MRTWISPVLAVALLIMATSAVRAEGGHDRATALGILLPWLLLALLGFILFLVVLNLLIWRARRRAYPKDDEE